MLLSKTSIILRKLMKKFTERMQNIQVALHYSIIYIFHNHLYLPLRDTGSYMTHSGFCFGF